MEPKEYIETEAIGGNGGVDFTIYKKDMVIKSLHFFWNDVTLKGIDVTLISDKGDTYTGSAGNKDSKESILEFDEDEYIEQLFIFKNQHFGGRCAGVNIKTNKKASVFEAGPRNGSRSQMIGGKAVGIKGKKGWDIDKLAFLYENPITSYEINDVVYDLSQIKSNLKPRLVAQSTLINKNPKTVKKTFSAKEVLTISNDWHHSLGAKIGVKAKGKAGVPFLAEGEWEVSAEFSYSYTWGETHSNSTEIQVSADVFLEPRTKVTCSAVLMDGEVNVPYKATADVTYRRGKATVSIEDGVYEGVGGYTCETIVDEPKPLEETDYKLVDGQSRIVKNKRFDQSVEEKIIVVE